MERSGSERTQVGRTGIVAALIGWLVLALVLPAQALAQEAPPADWRGALTCPAQYQAHGGLLYCTGTDRGGGTVHVIVADLSARGLRFEYVLPKGASGRRPRDPDCPKTPTEECRDPNVPAWAGPEKGCFVPCFAGIYPRLALDQAVVRAREVGGAEPAAVINGDYAAPDATHGPEGLLVVRGERLDGAAHCDDDYNAALRPWLGLGEAVDPSTGLLPAVVARLERDGAALPDWLYTGIGGGPWLVRDGALDEAAAGCQSSHRLDRIDPVENCSANRKSTPQPPLAEKYAEGSCRSAPHTAAGLSRDGRWLFLAVSERAARPDILAQFLRERLGAWNVTKLDGGGSSQLWFAGTPPQRVDPSGERRPLSSYLAAYAPAGNGIALPLEAEAAEEVYYKVLLPEEEATLEIPLRNSGNYTWLPEDGIELRVRPLVGAATSLPLAGRVPPGGTATWRYRVSGTRFERLQLARKGEPAGPEIGVVVVTVPQGMEEKREELEQRFKALVDEWKAKGERKLEDLLAALRKEAETQLKELVERGLGGICPGSATPVGLVAVAAVLAVRRRRS